MVAFEWILALLLGSVLLGLIARKVGAPYPSLLALAGSALAFLPFAPQIALPSELALALFVAPVLLDAAFDAPLRDIRENAFPVVGLVIPAVCLTTVGVAILAHALTPGMGWAVAITLGAIVAPPDAAAALAVLKQLRPPYRVLVILEGESLLNDASALIIYRLAVSAVAGTSVSLALIAPSLLYVVVGSILVGAVLSWAFTVAAARVQDVPSAIIIQFLGAFGVWLLAERIKLSGVLTVVIFAVIAARRTALTPARMRVPSFAVWETGVYVLNVIAFILMGLQIRPILSHLERGERSNYLLFAVAVLGAVVVIRIVWVMVVTLVWRRLYRRSQHRPRGGQVPPRLRGGFVVGWAGMRGVVTLAAAFALPSDFPFRNLILLAAFTVVLGTLIIQGMTVAPLVRLLRLPPDHVVDHEVHVTREALARAALQALDDASGPAAEALRLEYESALEATRRAPASSPGEDTEHDVLRRRVVEAQRQTLARLRAQGEIGDDAFHRVEEELDWSELYSSRTIPR